MSVGAVNKQTGERIPTAGMPAVDSVLSGSSTNPVQNRVVKAALDDKADTDMVAADFNAGSSYTAGNYCIYEGKFYKFKNSHSGAWSAADVDEIKIAGELSALKSGLIAKIEEIYVGEVTGATLADFILGALGAINIGNGKLTVVYAIYSQHDYYVLNVIRLYDDIYMFTANSTTKMYHGKAITGQNYVDVYEVTSTPVTN